MEVLGVEDDAVKDLIITGVKLTGRQLGLTSYDSGLSVVDYNGASCAAKIFDKRNRYKSLHFGAGIEKCLQECLLHSKLHHSNIVKMLGVYYANARDQAVLPVLVMEPMKCSLRQLLWNYKNVLMYVKLSILQDVSRGICYLRNLNPPVLHCDLTNDHILLTTSLVAKVYDFEKSIISSSPSEQTKLPGNVRCMPPEAHHGRYGLPLDVFSLGCLVCDLITRHLPYYHPSEPLYPPADYAITARKYRINQISEGSLKQLVITCLDNDPERRPPVSVVSERIASIITG